MTEQAGGENLGRLKSRLRREPRALAALAALGLNAASVDRLHLGLKEPYRSRADGLEIRDAVCYPVMGEGLRAVGRYAYLNLPGLTSNPPSQTTWGPGPPLVYRIGSYRADADALVSADVLDCWLAWQLAHGDDAATAFISRTHSQGWPPEWSDPAYWTGFRRVIVLPGAGRADFVREFGLRIGRPILELALPDPSATMSTLCLAPSRVDLRDLIKGATAPQNPAATATTATVPAEVLGRFAARPVRVTGAFVAGFGYYPFSVEKRMLEGPSGAERQVQSYETLVLRSDGRILSTELLPAPKGTPRGERVLALSDGTRIIGEPIASRTGTWSFFSISAFASWKTAGAPPPFRPFSQLVADVELFVRERVWLPLEGHYLLAALYVALSHVHQVFDALPLLLISGDRGTGKSELGEAIARLSFNATVVGQLRAAGMIRLLDETQGLIVLDDMDGVGPNSLLGNGELAQAIKTSYKRSTATKPVADRGAKVRMVDFYGCKVISNTSGVDAVLASRMVAICTADAAEHLVLPVSTFGEARCDGLRDELHCWAMAHGAELHKLYSSLPLPMNRRAEITLPLEMLAAAAGGVVPERLQQVLSHANSFPSAR